MATAFESLQERVDAVLATGDAELAGRAWHALSKVLFEFTRFKTNRAGPSVPMIQRVNSMDVAFLLDELRDRRIAHDEAAACEVQ